ncbi:Mitogen-activated protein kinase [Venturia nashicola]|uniref:Mitogen-activated protein kinase n=1 Tax=Venturia nashicola TaxID=86259 RepID=A0A4Z1NCW6_9PEZI|nr:Mitogen-activated protein kinase [Venturia nashicola]
MKRKIAALANTGVKRQKATLLRADTSDLPEQASDLPEQASDLPQQASDLPQQASLLGIPVELRLQILELLLPDIHHTPECNHTTLPHTIKTEHNHEHCRSFTLKLPLRRDEAKCWPKILLANRQIYNEGKSQMHKDKSVEIRINPNETQLAHFTTVKLAVSLTLQDIVSNAPGRRLRTNQKFTQMKLVVCELAHALAALKGLTVIDVTVNVHFEEKLYTDMEEALGMDIAELLQDHHMKELIGRSVVWLLGPFNQIHNLKTADYGVGITGLKNPPVITWNSGLVKFLNEVATQSISRRSGRARGNPIARPEDQDLDFSDFLQ